MAQPNTLELAKQGDAKAIAVLMNRSLQPKGITARAAFKDSCLQVMLEAAQVPEQKALVLFIRKSMTRLGAESINKVKVYGRQTGEEFPAWSQEFELVATINSPILPIKANVKPQHSIFKVKPEKSNNLLPTQATNPTSQKLTTEECWATRLFITFSLLSLLLLFVNFFWAVTTGTIAFVCFTMTPIGKAVIAKQKQEAQQKAEAEIRCPKCRSPQVMGNKRGVSLANAITVGALTMGFGTLFGFLWGSNEFWLNCLKCGHRWKPRK